MANLPKKWLFLSIASVIATYFSVPLDKLSDIMDKISEIIGKAQNLVILIILLVLLVAALILKGHWKGIYEKFIKPFFEKIWFIFKPSPPPPPPPPPAMNHPFIKIIKGQRLGSKMAVPSTRLIIGRDAHYCQLVLPSPSHDVSRRHCTVHFNGREKVVMLEDCGSRNGTYVNGRDRLANGEVYRLRHGDRFRLGSSGEEFEVVFE